MKNKHDNTRLTTKDISAYCQVSKSTVLEWIKSDKLKAFSLPSGHYRIDKENFKAFLTRWNMPVKGWPFEVEEVMAIKGTLKPIAGVL